MGKTILLLLLMSHSNLAVRNAAQTDLRKSWSAAKRFNPIFAFFFLCKAYLRAFQLVIVTLDAIALWSVFAFSSSRNSANGPFSQGLSGRHIADQVGRCLLRGDLTKSALKMRSAYLRREASLQQNDAIRANLKRAAEILDYVARNTATAVGQDLAA